MIIETFIFFFRALILVAGSLAGFWWLKHRWNVPLSFFQIISAYLIKVIAGIAYGLIFLKFYNGDDTWFFNNGVKEQLELLRHEPLQFIIELSPKHFLSLYPSLGEALHMYTGSLEYWLITKPLALLYLFTGGAYNLNLLIYNFISMVGLLLLYRWLSEMDVLHKKLHYVILFLLPSSVFWLSGIRADGYLFTSLIVLLYYFHQILKQLSKSHFIYCGLGMLGVFILRNYILLLFFPALLAWAISFRVKRSPIQIIIWVYGIVLLLFFLSGFCSNAFNLMHLVTHKQAAFLALKGNTRFDMNPLEPTFWSFVSNLPQAMLNGLFRPYLWEWKGTLQLVATLEPLFLLIGISIFTYRQRSSNYLTQFPIPVLLFILTGFILCVFIGYTVPFPGAIVRYKVVGQVLILIGLVAKKPSTQKTN